MSTESKANPDAGPSVVHDFDCTHDPCRCASSCTCEQKPCEHSPDSYEGSMEQRWRYAEANVSMLRDALGEFFEFVKAELDPDPGEWVGAYLVWNPDRLAALLEVMEPRNA